MKRTIFLLLAGVPAGFGIGQMLGSIIIGYHHQWWEWIIAYLLVSISFSMFFGATLLRERLSVFTHELTDKFGHRHEETRVIDILGYLGECLIAGLLWIIIAPVLFLAMICRNF